MPPLAMLLWLFAAGCPPEAPTDVEFDARSTEDAGTDGGDRDIGEYNPTVVPTMDGTWLLYAQAAFCIDLFGSEEGFSRTLFIVEAVQDEIGFVNETWISCDHEFPVVLGLETFPGPGLLESVYPVSSVDGFVSSTAVGGGYASGTLAEVWGIHLEDDLHDDFPTSPEDPRIFDADLDGHPGVTVVVAGQCDNYQVQRAITDFQGLYTAPDRIEGSLITQSEALTVGASTGFCATPYETRPNGSRSTFARVRIDGRGGSLDLDEDGNGEITCDEVRPYFEILFDRTPVDDSYCEL